MGDARTPYDGKPFYCKYCGLWIGEYYACEELSCELETVAEAQERAASHRLKGMGNFIAVQEQMQ